MDEQNPWFWIIKLVITTYALYMHDNSRIKWQVIYKNCEIYILQIFLCIWHAPFVSNTAMMHKIP